jgi:hypothetical protein
LLLKKASGAPCYHARLARPEKVALRFGTMPGEDEAGQPSLERPLVAGTALD